MSALDSSRTTNLSLGERPGSVTCKLQAQRVRLSLQITDERILSGGLGQRPPGAHHDDDGQNGCTIHASHACLAY